MRVLVRNNKETSHLPFTPNHSRTRCGLEDSRGTAAPWGPRPTALLCEGAWQRWSRLHPHRPSLQERCTAGAAVWPLRVAVCAECPARLWSGLLRRRHRGCLASAPGGFDAAPSSGPSGGRAAAPQGQAQGAASSIFISGGCASGHVGLQLPDQGSNLCLLRWTRGVLTTGLPGRSLFSSFYCENRKTQEWWTQRTARG